MSSIQEEYQNISKYINSMKALEESLAMAYSTSLKVQANQSINLLPHLKHVLNSMETVVYELKEAVDCVNNLMICLQREQDAGLDKLLEPLQEKKKQ